MNIFCIGRNYVAHAEELGNEVPDDPVVFMKPSTCMKRSPKPVYYPPFTKELHYEGELVVRIRKVGKSIQPGFASDYYDQVTLGFDLTARDLQRELKKKGLPWEISKAFDGAAVVGKLIPLADARNADGRIHFTIEKNGEMVQSGDTGLMIWPVDALIVHLSRFFTLRQGDLIFTGTPAGVGPVAVGDVLTGRIGERELVRLPVR